MFSRILLGLLAALSLCGQSQAPEFEVASVKPSPPPDAMQAALRSTPMAEMFGFKGGPGSANPGRIDYSANLKMLLVRAYGVRPYQICGPAWLDTEFYDIVATLPRGTTSEQLRLMLQRLLIERFRIESHRESRQMPIYTLTLARSGFKLKPAEPSAEGPAKSQAAIAAARLATQARRREDILAGFTGRVTLSNVTLADFTRELSRQLDAPVRDQTGIEGRYDFDLKWAADNARQTMPTLSSDGLLPPSLFSAVQEQLGLKLETGKAPVEALVVDKAEKTPIEN